MSFAIDEDGSLVVQQGVSANDDVIVSPNADLRDGDPISPQHLCGTHRTTDSRFEPVLAVLGLCAGLPGFLSQRRAWCNRLQTADGKGSHGRGP